MWLFDLFFLSILQMICQGTNIWKYFRVSLGLRDNESWTYLNRHVFIMEWADTGFCYSNNIWGHHYPDLWKYRWELSYDDICNFTHTSKQIMDFESVSNIRPSYFIQAWKNKGLQKSLNFSDPALTSMLLSTEKLNLSRHSGETVLPKKLKCKTLAKWVGDPNPNISVTIIVSWTGETKSHSHS